jgi:hypothetical protein
VAVKPRIPCQPTRQAHGHHPTRPPRPYPAWAPPATNPNSYRASLPGTPHGHQPTRPAYPARPMGTNLPGQPTRHALHPLPYPAPAPPAALYLPCLPTRHAMHPLPYLPGLRSSGRLLAPTRPACRPAPYTRLPPSPRQQHTGLRGPKVPPHSSLPGLPTRPPHQAPRLVPCLPCGPLPGCQHRLPPWPRSATICTLHFKGLPSSRRQVPPMTACRASDARLPVTGSQVQGPAATSGTGVVGYPGLHCADITPVGPCL